MNTARGSADPAIAKALDAMAANIFRIALAEGRSGEVLAHLFEGGSITVDAHVGELVFYPRELVDLVKCSDEVIGAVRDLVDEEEARDGNARP